MSHHYDTDLDTYLQAKNTLVNSIFAQVDWIVKGPAEDKMFGNYPFEGAESKNKKVPLFLEYVWGKITYE